MTNNIPKLSLLLSLIAYTNNADFDSYAGNCGFVYDEDLDEIFPINTCITNYQKNATNEYTSRIYICEALDDIEVYTFYADSCASDTSTADSQRSALSSDNTIYSCGDDETNGVDECYLTYKQYMLENADAECSGWSSASYESKFIVVGACINGPYNYQYSICDTSDTADFSMESGVDFVRFNDDTCCELSYAYTGMEGPAWESYQIYTGCDQDSNTYIDPESWMCMIPDEANDYDVYTDNTDPECTAGVSQIIAYGLFIAIGIVFLM